MVVLWLWWGCDCKAYTTQLGVPLDMEQLATFLVPDLGERQLALATQPAFCSSVSRCIFSAIACRTNSG